MKFTHLTLARGIFWTTTSYVIAQLVRFSTNIILTRLLAPQLFGIMVIVNTLKTGVELLTDVGIGQGIVQNKYANDPKFYNTAWTITSIRGVLLWIVACIITVPVAHFYRTPSLILIMPIAAFVLVFSGFTPPSRFLMQRRMQFARLNAFDLANLMIWAVVQITLAYFFPTIWALVIGLLLGSLSIMISSFFVVPGLKPRFTISRTYTAQILHFGKWIFLTSMVFFLSMSFDRLYFARVIPLALLGVYGISRTISELLTTLAIRLGNIVVFPFIASHAHLPRFELRGQLRSIRLSFLTIAAIGFSFSVAIVDLAVKILFDQRYHAAAWMVPILILGAWVSILTSLNESMLLGLGQPRYAAIGSATKFIWLLIALPLSLTHFGFVGSVMVIAVSDIFRYAAAFAGQRRERFSFGKQDLAVTLLMLVLAGIFEWLRWSLGLATSFESLPIFK